LKTWRLAPIEDVMLAAPDTMMLRLPDGALNPPPSSVCSGDVAAVRGWVPGSRSSTHRRIPHVNGFGDTAMN
jgi:hypothetical protein